MAHSITTKSNVIELRKSGGSIRDIAKISNLPKSTVSYWCRDIKMTASQLKVLQSKCKKAGSAKCLEIAEEKRAERIERERKIGIETSKNIGALNERDLEMLGIGLYWGEGYKKGSSELGFTNSDPDMITVYIEWLQKIFRVERKNMTLRVSINNSHKDRAENVLSFWSNHTSIPTSQFTKTSFIKSKVKKIYPNRDTHFGTLRIKVKKSSVLKLKTLGAISHISKTINKRSD